MSGRMIFQSIDIAHKFSYDSRPYHSDARSEFGLVTVLYGYPALTEAARKRRIAKAAQARLTRPGGATIKFTGAEIAALAQTYAGKPLGIAPAALKAMLQERRL